MKQDLQIDRRGVRRDEIEIVLRNAEVCMVSGPILLSFQRTSSR